MNRIEFNRTGDGENDFGVHFTHPLQDYTLCGLTLDGDTVTAGGFEMSNKRVNCKDCIRLVKYCKAIKSTEYSQKTFGN